MDGCLGNGFQNSYFVLMQLQKNYIIKELASSDAIPLFLYSRIRKLSRINLGSIPVLYVFSVEFLNNTFKFQGQLIAI